MQSQARKTGFKKRIAGAGPPLFPSETVFPTTVTPASTLVAAPDIAHSAAIPAFPSEAAHPNAYTGAIFPTLPDAWTNPEPRITTDPRASADKQADTLHSTIELPKPSQAISHLPMIRIYDIVRATRLPNFLSARIPVLSNLNIPMWRRLFGSTHPELCDMLEFGWPISYTGDSPPSTEYTNHTSAHLYSDNVSDYIEKEISLGAMLGPFKSIPFVPWTHVSPLMTRPKRGTDARRIITDLSWPRGSSVNTGIIKGSYLGVPSKVCLPSIQRIIDMVKASGPGSYMSSIDIERAYSQLKIDPSDMPFQGVFWNNNWYIATSVQFGSRHGSWCCQSTTGAIRDLLISQGYSLEVYIDDYALSHPTLELAMEAHTAAECLLDDLGLKRSLKKNQPPTQDMIYLGYRFNTHDMTVSIPPDRLQEVKDIVRQWINRPKATRLQLQSLLGKLFYGSRCSHPARLFVSRMLDTLREAPDQGSVPLTLDFKKDLLWFHHMLSAYNATHLISAPLHTHHVFLQVNFPLATGICSQWAFTYNFDGSYQTTSPHTLVLMCTLLALRTWPALWQDSKVVFYTTSTRANDLINTGATRDKSMLSVARQIWLLTALSAASARARFLSPDTLIPVPNSITTPPMDALCINSDL